MTADNRNRNIILITAIALCLVPAGCDSSKQPATPTAINYADGPSREECAKVTLGMTAEEATSILGTYGMSLNVGDTLRQIAWCVVSCDPKKGDGIFIAHLDDGSITSVEFSPEAKLVGGI